MTLASACCILRTESGKMFVNGEEVQSPAGTLLELIESFGLDPLTVAVERNGEIPPRETWESLRLTTDDRIELIRFVGGG